MWPKSSLYANAESWIIELESMTAVWLSKDQRAAKGVIFFIFFHSSIPYM